MLVRQEAGKGSYLRAARLICSGSMSPPPAPPLSERLGQQDIPDPIATGEKLASTVV